MMVADTPNVLSRVPTLIDEPEEGPPTATASRNGTGESFIVMELDSQDMEALELLRAGTTNGLLVRDVSLEDK